MTFEPSRGGMGSKLNIASCKFTKVPTLMTGTKRLKIKKMAASTIFDAGPTTETKPVSSSVALYFSQYVAPGAMKVKPAITFMSKAKSKPSRHILNSLQAPRDLAMNLCALS